MGWKGKRGEMEGGQRREFASDTQRDDQGMEQRLTEAGEERIDYRDVIEEEMIGFDKGLDVSRGGRRDVAPSYFPLRPH